MKRTNIWNGNEGPALTPFALDINAPIYSAQDGTSEFNRRLTEYVLECEQIIKEEPLVTDVTKNKEDPYALTQQWKQHNLFDDTGPRKEGDHLVKFKPNTIQQELFNKFRENYLLMLSDIKAPRVKVYAHCWANVLRPGEFISPHSHINSPSAYLAGTYYPQSDTSMLHLVHPTGVKGNYKTEIQFETKESRLILFPSWIFHYSDPTNITRISIAVDIVLPITMEHNPWRPHVVFDDPKTMKGL
jgi:hypothetical protein